MRWRIQACEQLLHALSGHIYIEIRITTITTTTTTNTATTTAAAAAAAMTVTTALMIYNQQPTGSPRTAVR